MHVRTISVLTILGLVLLTWGFAGLRQDNWMPFRHSSPRTGQSVTDSAFLTSGGRFIVEVSVRTPNHGFRPAPQLPARMSLLILGPAGFRSSHGITAFRNGGWSSSDMVLFGTEPFELPRFGRYEFRLDSSGTPAELLRPDVKFTVRRFQPVGPELGFQLALYVGVVLLLVTAGLSARIVWQRARA